MHLFLPTHYMKSLCTSKGHEWGGGGRVTRPSHITPRRNPAPIKKETGKATETVRTLFNPLLLPGKVVQPKVESPLTAIQRLQQARRLHNLISYFSVLYAQVYLAADRRKSAYLYLGTHNA